MHITQIEEYMEQLDNNKIPRVGTAGEKYRDIQLIVQLPKQDLAEEYCKQLLAAIATIQTVALYRGTHKPAFFKTVHVAGMA